MKAFRQQVGVQGEENTITLEWMKEGDDAPCHVTYLGRSGNPTDGLPRNMDGTWTTYYGKDFTRIVLELIGALEQRIINKMEELCG